MSVKIINLLTGQPYDFRCDWCAPKRCHCETIKQWILSPW